MIGFVLFIICITMLSMSCALTIHESEEIFNFYPNFGIDESLYRCTRIESKVYEKISNAYTALNTIDCESLNLTVPVELDTFLKICKSAREKLDENIDESIIDDISTLTGLYYLFKCKFMGELSGLLKTFDDCAKHLSFNPKTIHEISNVLISARSATIFRSIHACNKYTELKALRLYNILECAEGLDNFFETITVAVLDRIKPCA